MIKLKTLIIAAALLVWTVTVFLFGQQVYKVAYWGQFQSAQGATDTIAYINNVRAEHRLKPLTENETLNQVAKIKACDMQTRGYFDHEDPEGRMPWHLFTENGYNYLWAGENLAQGYAGLNATMQHLLNSQEHLDNILSPHYTEVGVANCGMFYVQEYGDPK